MDGSDVERFDHTTPPQIKVLTLGEFALERLIPSSSPENSHLLRYIRVDPREWSNRRPAIALLKMLLCRPNRRANRDELIEAIWPDNETLNTAHALDSATSMLRKHLLRTHGGESLLLTIRSGSETVYRLPGQRLLWVDADELLELAARAIRAESLGQDPLPLLESAHALSRGEFLADDPYAEWAQGRRYTVEGARYRVLYQLVDRYLEEERTRQAEECLFAELERNPTDEDALCRLMILLVDQGRRQEALRLYLHISEVLEGEQSKPALYTQELAARIRRGRTLREQAGSYTTGRLQSA
jgi:DNA-binding SARP family transcriptional activator